MCGATGSAAIVDETTGELIKKVIEAMRATEDELIRELRTKDNRKYARATGDEALLRLLELPEPARRPQPADHHNEWRYTCRRDDGRAFGA